MPDWSTYLASAERSIYFPDTVNNLVLWLDADDLSTITTDGNGRVTTWLDKSSKANDVTAVGSGPTYVTNVQNSLPSLLFSKSDSTNLTSSLTTSEICGQSNYTVYMVVRRNSSYGNTFDCPFSISSINKQVSLNVNFYEDTAGSIQFNEAAYSLDGTSVSTFRSSSSASDIGGFGLIKLIYNTSSNQFRPAASRAAFKFKSLLAEDNPVSGNNLPGVIYTDSNNRVNIGRDYSTAGGIFNNYVSEVIVYNRTLTAQENGEISYYMQWKWGLPSA